MAAAERKAVAAAGPAGKAVAAAAKSGGGGAKSGGGGEQRWRPGGNSGGGAGGNSGGGPGRNSGGGPVPAVRPGVHRCPAAARPVAPGPECSRPGRTPRRRAVAAASTAATTAAAPAAGRRLRCRRRPGQAAEHLAGDEAGQVRRDLAGDVGGPVDQRDQRQRVVGGQSDGVDRQARSEAFRVLQVRVADRRHRSGDGRQVHGHDAGRVGARPAQHVAGVCHRVVVPQDRGHHVGLVAQIEPATAQVARRGQGRVEQVLHLGLAVAVTVGGVPRPGTRQELHRAHRPGIGHPLRRPALHDDLVARQRSVQRGPVDGPHSRAAGIGGAAVGVHGFDPPDARQQVPADAAARIGGGHHAFGVAVGGQRHRRNTKGARRIHHHRGRGSGDVRGRDVKRGRRLGDGHHRGAGALARWRFDGGQAV